MRTIDTVLCAIHKKIPFFALYIPSLMRDFFLNALTPIQKNANYIIVRIAKSRLSFISLHFSFFIFFLIYCLFWNLELGFNVTSHYYKLSHYDTVMLDAIIQNSSKKERSN